MSPSLRLSNEQLTSIRQNTQWRDLFAALQIQKDPKKSKETDWWGKSPFRPDEQTASFHMNVRGWYCHATGKGGGPIELLQRLNSGMSCYDAGRWLLEHRVSRITTEVREDVEDWQYESGEEAQANPQPENLPIRQDLRSQLIPGHPHFEARSIPDQVLCELGAGYLDRAPRKNGKPDPMNHRLVFQIRGLQEGRNAKLETVILGHMGRATTEEQAEQDGKWWTYAGFRKSLELYNADLAVKEEEARQQAQSSGHLLVVEGCFDLAKVRAGGIRNVVATFGSRISAEQAALLRRTADILGIEQIRLFFDRDDAGEKGTASAYELLAALDLTATSFNWAQTWRSPRRGEIGIPPSISDPCDFSIGQLQWLRSEGLI